MRCETANGDFFPLLFKSVNYSSSLCVKFMQILFCKVQTVLDDKSFISSFQASFHDENDKSGTRQWLERSVTY